MVVSHSFQLVSTYTFPNYHGMHNGAIAGKHKLRHNHIVCRHMAVVLYAGTSKFMLSNRRQVYIREDKHMKGVAEWWRQEGRASLNQSSPDRANY